MSPPPLNVVIQVVGSRGYVQPFVALGRILKKTYNHRVRIATHGVFQKFVEENDLEFFNIGGDPAALMAFMVKNPGLFPTMDTVKRGDIGNRRREIFEIMNGCWKSCFQAGTICQAPISPMIRSLWRMQSLQIRPALHISTVPRSWEYHYI